MEALIAVVALLAGLGIGFWIKAAVQKGEKSSLESRSGELAQELAAVRASLDKAQSDLAAQAGAAALAEERAKSMERLVAERDQARGQLQASEAGARTQTARISQLEAELRAERQSLQEKVALLEEAKKSLSDNFQALAAEILDQKSKNFSEGSQKEIATLLQPLRTQIEDFRKKVEEAQTDSKTGVTKLETLIGNLNGMNQQLAEEARNLSTALRGSSKAQGDWGEFILRDLLEKAGLREGEQYSFQQVFADAVDEDGKKKVLRTDVVLLLPGGRNLVIDSKVSLSAYTDYASAESDEPRKAALKAHLTSVRGHLSILTKAGYQNLPGLESPDFVVMFVPVEPAFLLALQADAELWADAYRQGVLLVGPTTLLYVIRIVDVLWRQEQQARNVRDVMERGAALYEKFVGFVADLQAVGANLQKTEQSYQGAMKKLSEGPGNLVRQVELLKQLGLRSAKQLPAQLLDRAGVEEPGLALAAQAGEDPK
jgi:DNA recombination protein RmuC